MDSPLTLESMRLLLRRAARVCAACLLDEVVAEEPCPDAALLRAGGAFVTLKRKGVLAGCIGYVQSEDALWETVRAAARAAALQDSRFERIEASALKEVEVELSVLSPSRPIAPEEVVVGRHGLLIELGGRRGLLLPQVAREHGLDRLGFLNALARKAGLPPDSWEQEDCRLAAFEAQLMSGVLLELCAEGWE